jgi:hypothetical protein
VTILKVPRTKIYQLRQDPQNEVFDDARLISNNLAKHVVAMLYPVPGATFTIGSILYPEGVQPPEIQSRTDGREVEEITFWLIESNPVP